MRIAGLLLLLTFLTALHAQESAAPHFEESFIAMKIAKKKGSSFYKVYVDEDENPFLNVEDIIKNYLDLTNTSCDLSRLYCQGTMQPDRIVHWIDFKELAMGNSKDGRINKTIKKNDFVVKDGKIWLKFDAWEKWLDVESKWSLEMYYLYLAPNFNLAYQNKAEREKNIKLQILRRDEKEKFNRLPVNYAKNQFNVHGRYRLAAEKNSGEEASGTADYYLKANVYRGVLDLGGSGFVSESTKEMKRPYWMYSLTDEKYFHKFQVGHTSFSSNTVLLPYVHSEEGVSVERLEKKVAAGNIVIRKQTEPNTLVDLYLNGIYMSSTTSDDKGTYEFTDLHAAGGDSYTLKLFFSDGAKSEFTYNIASDGNRILPKREFDVKGYYGDSSDGNFAYASLRYGLIDDVTLGLHPLKLPGSNDSSTLLDLAIRPFYGVAFHGEALVSKDGTDKGFLADLSFLEPNKIQIEYKDLFEESPLLYDSRSTVGKSWRVQHSISFGRFQLRDVYRSKVGEKSETITLRYRYNSSFNLSLAGVMKWYDYTETQKNIVTDFNYLIRPHSEFRLSRRWLADNRNTSLFYRFKGEKTYPVDASLSLVVPDDSSDEDVDKVSYMASLGYRITEKLILKLQANNEYVGFRVTWDDVVAMKPGPSKPRDFGTGTLTGRIMSPKIPKQKQYPLEGVTVFAGSKKAVSDKKGYYQVTGISPEMKVKVHLVANSLDATMAPKEEFKVYYFKPCSTMVYNPEVLPTVGVDGVLDTDGDIPPNSQIVAIRQLDGKVVAESKPEDDGFFVVEGLTPGIYMFHLRGVKNPPSPLKVELLPGNDWVSGKRWLWRQK